MAIIRLCKSAVRSRTREATGSEPVQQSCINLRVTSGLPVIHPEPPAVGMRSEARQELVDGPLLIPVSSLAKLLLSAVGSARRPVSLRRQKDNGSP